MEATRRMGEDIDIGLRRHYLDPGEPFSRTVLNQAHGAVITSATLTDHTDAAIEMPLEADWEFAAQLTGAVHLPILLLFPQWRHLLIMKIKPRFWWSMTWIARTRNANRSSDGQPDAG